jgi:hypothetical protein
MVPGSLARCSGVALDVPLRRRRGHGHISDAGITDGVDPSQL